ncbi:MAG: rhodanese-like domain-containing protein [Alphaproteobacteria bacterium]
MQAISREEVKSLIDSGAAVIIEALPEEEFAKGHLPGALSMPVNKIGDLAPKKLKDMDQQIITYCASAKCPASHRAAETLEKLGYTNVSEYAEGKEDWKKAGLPLEGALATERVEESDEVDGEAEAVSTTTTDDIERARNNPDADDDDSEVNGREL